MFLDFPVSGSLRRRLTVVSISRSRPVRRLDHTRRRMEDKDTNNDYHDDTHPYLCIYNWLVKTLLDMICRDHSKVHLSRGASAM